MADSKRLQILKLLTAQLKTVTVANGYQFDLSQSVFRGRSGFGEETPKPCVGIFELRPEDAVRADETVQKDDWFIALQGYVEADDEHPTDPAHNLMADVKKALGVIMRPDSPVNRNPNHMFGGAIADMQADGGVVFPPSGEAQDITTFLLKLTLSVVDDQEDPYA